LIVTRRRRCPPRVIEPVCDDCLERLPHRDHDSCKTSQFSVRRPLRAQDRVEKVARVTALEALTKTLDEIIKQCNETISHAPDSVNCLRRRLHEEQSRAAVEHLANIAAIRSRHVARKGRVHHAPQGGVTVDIGVDERPEGGDTVDRGGGSEMISLYSRSCTRRPA
jgi:hypothetical protein